MLVYVNLLNFSWIYNRCLRVDPIHHSINSLTSSSCYRAIRRKYPPPSDIESLLTMGGGYLRRFLESWAQNPFN